MEKQKNQENDKSINEKGNELLEVIKNSKCKISSVSIINRRGKTVVMKDDPLFFKLIEDETEQDNDKDMPVCFLRKNKHNASFLMIKFWDTDLFMSLYDNGFKVGYNSYKESPKFYIIISLDKIKDFDYWNLEGQKLAENY